MARFTHDNQDIAMIEEIRFPFQVGDKFILQFTWTTEQDNTPVSLADVNIIKIDFKQSQIGSAILQLELNNGINITDVEAGIFELVIDYNKQLVSNINAYTYLAGDLLIVFNNGDSSIPVRLVLDIQRTLTAL